MATDDNSHGSGTWKRGIGNVHVFAKNVLEFGSDRRLHILDLGCGAGKDAMLFAKKGHRVTGIDGSDAAIDALNAAVRKARLRNVRAVCADIAESLPCKTKEFDAVYAHLSLHYFDTQKTGEIFKEIRRVLATDGMLFVKCISVDDPLYGQGEKVGEDMYRTDRVVHFFSEAFMADALADFQVMILRKASSTHGGKTSAFIEAVARK